MKVTEVRIHMIGKNKKAAPLVKAFADVVFDGCFIVRGLVILHGERGYLAGMPSRRCSDKKFRDIAHPLNNKFRAELEDAVIAAYEKYLNDNQGQSTTHD